MMLSIAFLMFAMLVAGWLFVPERGTAHVPAPTPAPVAPEPAPSRA